VPWIIIYFGEKLIKLKKEEEELQVIWNNHKSIISIENFCYVKTFSLFYFLFRVSVIEKKNARFVLYKKLLHKYEMHLDRVWEHRSNTVW